MLFQTYIWQLRPALLVFIALGASCSFADQQKESQVNHSQTASDQKSQELQRATFGAGCFWCVEAVFENVKGVHSVESGFTGGAAKNPSYLEVMSGRTGHAEVCQIKYDPKEVTYDALLEVFWKTHDPTTLNRQGPDAGTQYRSVILYHNDEQKRLAEDYKTRLDQSGVWNDPVVTEIARFTDFYKAEKYHQDFFRRNPNQAYCRAVIRPKIEKFKQVFRDKLKNK